LLLSHLSYPFYSWYYFSNFVGAFLERFFHSGVGGGDGGGGGGGICGGVGGGGGGVGGGGGGISVGGVGGVGGGVGGMGGGSHFLIGRKPIAPALGYLDRVLAYLAIFSSIRQR